MRIAVLLPLPLALAAAAMAQTPSQAKLVNNTGAEIGTVRFTAAPKGVLIGVAVDKGGLSAGWHGLHLHEAGDCSDTASFEKSKDHVAYKEGGHGLLNSRGPEDGDLPNLFASADGSASGEFFSTLTTLSKLQDADGSALLIHAQPDDHTSQPIGGAGDRVACAVVPK